MLVKKFYCSILFVLIVGTLFAQESAVFEEPKNGPKIVFSEDRHEFGDIIQGDVIEHVFEFTNSGNAPLVLQDVKTTCGCTVPEWPRSPLAPGATAELKVKFNSAGKIGIQNKVITVISNATNQTSRVMIVTNVNPKS
ncbi:MAG: DUF1573 domain-containing protein [Flammeovirgaceae bacterium]|jgi:hypothetical protein|nr:DUF1573 domain-containing protein [Flammeovirgaceae bacterium]